MTLRVKRRVLHRCPPRGSLLLSQLFSAYFGIVPPTLLSHTWRHLFFAHGCSTHMLLMLYDDVRLFFCNTSTSRQHETHNHQQTLIVRHTHDIMPCIMVWLCLRMGCCGNIQTMCHTHRVNICLVCWSNHALYGASPHFINNQQ